MVNFPQAMFDDTRGYFKHWIQNEAAVLVLKSPLLPPKSHIVTLDILDTLQQHMKLHVVNTIINHLQ